MSAPSAHDKSPRAKAGSRAGRRGDRWIRPFFKQYRGALILALLLGVATYVFASALMFSSGYLISRAAEAPGNIVAIFVPVALVRIFGVGKPILQYAERLVSHNWILRMTSSLRLKLYNALERDAIFFKQRFRTGDILGLLAEDIGHIQNLYLRSIFPLIRAWVLTVLIVVCLGFFSLWFALAMLLMLSVIVLLVPLVSALRQGACEARRKTMKNQLYEQLTDNVLGVSDWIISGRSDEYTQTYRASEEALRGVEAKLHRASRNRDLLLQVLYALVVVALLAWAAFQFGGSYGGAADWIAAFVLGFFPLIEVFAPLPKAAVEMNSYRDSADRLGRLPHEDETAADTGERARAVSENPSEERPLSAPDDTPRQDAAEHISATPRAPLTLAIKGLAYRYSAASRSVLHDIDLTLAPGEKLAILGRSGAGKSTLAALIRGDLVPTRGSVELGGVATCALGDRITEYVGVVQQQSYLFNATLAENLRIGNQRASDEELWEVLESVGLGELGRRLPSGLDTLVDEAGLRFSGGEQHRIALARVLLSDVPLVILDEPGVGLDPVSEQLLLDTLFKTLRDKTLIMITHHLQGVSLMDRVIFIEDGSLCLSGSPGELAQSNAYYQKLLAFDTGSAR
ncbi:MAG: thiol reductant ABC exporter subunit CydC [Coriobacteriales bacterium]|jgi:ATP-binding cassette subfamily C protein CydC|nr:thiol reductant ABC exporter subunit CydC [Coriobacteriales bacterium]